MHFLLAARLLQIRKLDNQSVETNLCSPWDAATPIYDRLRVWPTQIPTYTHTGVHVTKRILSYQERNANHPTNQSTAWQLHEK